jgi:AraC-like DNA-binding protein
LVYKSVWTLINLAAQWLILHSQPAQFHTHSYKLFNMDNLAGILDGPRARGAFTLRTVMSGQWSLRIAAESPLTLLAGIEGEAWVLFDEVPPIRIGPGDIAITRGPDHYTVAATPSAVPDVIVYPGQNCCDLDGNSVEEKMTHGIRTWGNDATGNTVFLVGSYEQLSDISDRLMRALPPVLSLSSDDWDSPLIALLEAEVVKDDAGQAAVLDRLLDLLLTAVLRSWFAQQDAQRPDSWRSQGDPIIERALRCMHDDPAHPWTMETLARSSGASRASLARRFQDLVGEPPMTFLKNWRLALAADLLCQPGETVATVAEKIGYASPYAFSAAFKRVRGISPKDHRAQAAR